MSRLHISLARFWRFEALRSAGEGRVWRPWTRSRHAMKRATLCLNEGAVRPSIGQALAFRAFHDAASALGIVNAHSDAVAVAEIKFSKIAMQMLLAAMRASGVLCYLAHRLAAPFLAISFLRFLLRLSARALPPMRPSATAAAFLPSSVVTSLISPVAILAIMTARAFTSAGRFSPFGPRGIMIG